MRLHVCLFFFNRIVRKVKKETVCPASGEAKTVRPASRGASFYCPSGFRGSGDCPSSFRGSFILLSVRLQRKRRLSVQLQGELHSTVRPPSNFRGSFIPLSVRLQGKRRLSVRLQGELHCLSSFKGSGDCPSGFRGSFIVHLLY